MNKKKATIGAIAAAMMLTGASASAAPAQDLELKPTQSAEAVLFEEKPPVTGWWWPERDPK
jgi:hypothetical protein